MSNTGRRTVPNTKAIMETPEGNEAFLLGGIRLGGSRVIEAMEAEGQRALVESDVLPVQAESRSVLEAAGVVFGEPVENDPIFCYATLPPGWKRVATDHVMWTHLLDENGRVRAKIFYKAAHYDRGATLHAACRYRLDLIFTEKDLEIIRTGRDLRAWGVFDGKRELFRSNTYPAVKSQEDLGAYDRERGAAEAWLNEHFPNWRNPAAYWTDPCEPSFRPHDHINPFESATVADKAEVPRFDHRERGP